MIRRTVLAAALALPLLVTGCGSPEEPAAAAEVPMSAVPGDPGTTEPTASAEDAGGTSSVDPCTVLTKAEAQQLARMPLGDGVPAGGTNCTYTAPPTGPTGQVEVGVGPGAKKFLDIDRQLKHEFRALPGVGDEAWAEDGAVFVRVGGTWVSVALVKLNDPAENRTPLEAAAKTVAGRL